MKIEINFYRIFSTEKKDKQKPQFTYEMNFAQNQSIYFQFDNSVFDNHSFAILSLSPPLSLLRYNNSIQESDEIYQNSDKKNQFDFFFFLCKGALIKMNRSLTKSNLKKKKNRESRIFEREKTKTIDFINFRFDNYCHDDDYFDL